MPTPLSELRSLFADRRAVPGRVLDVVGASARIATNTGVIELAQFDLQPGDWVTITNGRAVRTQAGKDIPVFQV